MTVKTITTGALAAMLALASLLGASSADAHISIHPNTVPAGAFATLDVRVPGEQEGAHVTSVDVLFPAGFTGVDYENVPGWSARVIERKLATPVHEGGETIDSEVGQIVWTWSGPLGRVDHGRFVQFPLSVAIPRGDAGTALEFRTVQSYSNGRVVHWIDTSLEAENPSPRINVTAGGGPVEDVAGDEAGPQPSAAHASASAPAAAGAPAATSTSGGASNGLAIAALVLGALGLLVALGALGATRRRR